MRKFMALLGILLSICGSAQTTNVTYTPSTAVISNPERGFYRYTATHAGSYNALNQTTLTNYRLNENITVIFRYFYMEDFLGTPISASYLTSVQNDFDKMRNAGVKCIIRFAYSSEEGVAQYDPTKAMILSHIQQIKPLLQANSDVICVMQAGFIGAWGEWYYTSQPEFGGWGYNQTDLTTSNYNHRKDILNAILLALPASRQVQIRYPAMKQHLFTTTPLSAAEAFTQTNASRVAHHNDCFLASATDYGTYENATAEYPYLAQETKFLAMGGETCKVNSPRSDCPTALLEMAKFHWSLLNFDYNTSVIDGFETNNCYTDIQKNLGYRFVLVSGTFPQAVTTINGGGTFPFTLKIQNQGYAAPFNERKAYIVLKNLTTNQVYSMPITSDPRTWLGPNEITITETLTLPTNLTTGNYKVYLSLPDSAPSLAGRPEYAIRMANDNVWESITGYNSLNHTLNVTGGTLGVADNSKLNMTIYPVPASSELNVELENIEEYKVSMFNSLGQKINVKTISDGANKVTINTGGLSDGLYFVELVKGATRDVRKVIVKH